MHIKQIEKVNNYYNELLEKHGQTPGSLGCPKGRQNTRFKNIDKIFFPGCTILDYGCGFSDLYNYLNLNFSGQEFTYTGCDIVPNFLKISKELYPDIRLIDSGIDKITNQYDITVAFGVFNFLYTKDQNEHFNIVKEKLCEIFSYTNKCLLIDFQTQFVDFKQADSYHQDIDSLIKFVVQKLSRRFEIIHSYLPYEYSIIIYKENEIKKEDNTFKQQYK